MADENYRRRLSAILSADVKGYSLLMADDELTTVTTLKSHKETMAAVIQEHNGRVVDSPGDNLLAEFASAVDAVKSAVKIQEELKAKNADLPENRRMQFRIGINIGDVIHENDRVYGDGVNVAARIESLADPGGVAISRNVCSQVKQKLELGYQYFGEHSVKNIAEPVRVYRVLMHPESAGKVIGEKRFLGKMSQRMAIAVFIILAIAIGGSVSYYIYLHQTGRIEPASIDKMAFPLPEKPSIAVLPFDSMSGDPDQEFLSDGITEEIITSLSKTDQLFVIARNSSFTYKGKPVDVKQVAEELGVQYVLEGSVRKSEDRVRITAQLIDAIKGHHLWAERYDRDLKEIFTLQDEITKKIVTALGVELTEGEQFRMWADRTEDLEYLLKFMKAISHLNKGSPEDLRAFGQIGKELIEMEPNNPHGYRILGWYHWLLAVQGVSPKESLAKAYHMAQKTLSLDESDSQAHALMGTIYLMMRQHDKAIAEGELAVALDPNNAYAHMNFGVILSFTGRLDEAIEHINRAIRIDPFPLFYCYVTLGRCYFLKRQFEKALVEYNKAYQLAPNNIIPLIGVTAAYGILGRENEARGKAEELLELNPDWNVAYVNRGPFKNPEDANIFIEALIKAGLPDKRQAALQDSLRKEEGAATTAKSNNVAIDLNGEWDTVYDLKEYGVSHDVVRITQKGNKFVGIKLIGSQWVPKGSETIKGDIEDNRIKSMYLKNSQGWAPAKWRVNEHGNEILLKQNMDSIGLTIDVKLTKK